MKFKGILIFVALMVFIGCSKKESVEVEVEVAKKFTLSGTVTSPSGAPLEGVQVEFIDGTTNYIDTTDESGKYSFVVSGNGTADVYFYGKPLRYLNMRDRKVKYGDFDRTNDKMMVPWEIEEIDFFNVNFIDNAEKTFSLVDHSFNELVMKPSDFKNLIGSIHLDKYETIFTSIQWVEEIPVTVSFYSMPNGTEYTPLNNDLIKYSDLIGWQKILTISTTTMLIDVREPVKVNLAAAFANYPDYDHSGTIIMVTEEISATLGVDSPVDVLEIRLPYGDDYE